MDKKIKDVSGTYKIVNSMAYALTMVRGTGKAGYREAKSNVLMGLGFVYNKDDKSLRQVKKSLPQLDKLFKLGTKGIIELQKTCKELNEWHQFPLKDNEKFSVRIAEMTPEKKAKKKKVSVKVTSSKAQDEKIAKLEAMIAQLMGAK